MPCKQKIKRLTPVLLHKLLAEENVRIQVEGEAIELTPEDVAVEREVVKGGVASTMGELTLALDTELTEPLILEGIARELVNKINTMRKENGFVVTDRVDVKIQTTAEVRRAFESHRDTICHETLALGFEFTSCSGQEWEINGHPTILTLHRIAYQK